MSKQQPGTEDWLGQEVKYSVGDDLTIHSGDLRALGNTPNTNVISTCYEGKIKKYNLHGINGPDNEGEQRQCPKESPSSVIFIGHGVAALVPELVDDSQEGYTGNRVPAPSLGLQVAEGGEERGQGHYHIGYDNDEDAIAAQPSEKSQI